MKCLGGVAAVGDGHVEGKRALQCETGKRKAQWQCKG